MVQEIATYSAQKCCFSVIVNTVHLSTLNTCSVQVTVDPLVCKITVS